MCTDTDDWLCPGWELCSDAHNDCTSTHCCADRRFACYQKRPHYAQCMPRGSCTPGVDGLCQETANELGQCSAPYHDCHLTGCCQRGEDHCFLKNEFYGQCRPTCNRAELGSDWSCERRELPTEQNKVTCETLRTRNNIFRRPCSTQYETPDQCNRAFTSQDNVYQPCVWHPESTSCMESGQTLECDCTLLGSHCPVVHTSAQADTGGEDLTNGEGIVVVIAIFVIISGCGGLAWYERPRMRPARLSAAVHTDGPRAFAAVHRFFFYQKSTSMAEQDGSRGVDDDDEDISTIKRKKNKKKYDRATELESMETDDL